MPISDDLSPRNFVTKIARCPLSLSLSPSPSLSLSLSLSHPVCPSLSLSL